MSAGFQAILLYMLVCVDGPLNASTDWLLVAQQNAYHLHTHMMSVHVYGASAASCSNLQLLIL